MKVPSWSTAPCGTPPRESDRALFSSLTERLNAGHVLLLDGGLSTELERRGYDISGPLWSARLYLENPSAIAEVQRDFLHAGAQVVTTATYQATHQGLSRFGLTAAEVDALLRRAAELAGQVADEHPGHRPLVVGSIGPYGALRHDGSEYTGAYDLRVGELRRFHRRRLHVLAEHCDVLAVETIPQLPEMEALVAELDELSTPCWICVNGSATTLASGESLVEAFELARSLPHLIAAGANCITPRDASALAGFAADVTGRPSVIYPNSGETYQDEQWSGTSSANLDVEQWLTAGAGIVGGCCRTTPADIRAMAAELEQQRSAT
jgi:homocysteine S-methyltransferase